MKHDGGRDQKGITLSEWQDAIKERHRMGSSGMEEAQQSEGIDFEEMA